MPGAKLHGGMGAEQLEPPGLQQAYQEAGSDILYAPTFQAQPIALEQVNLAKQTEAVNAALVALTRSAAEGFGGRKSDHPGRVHGQLHEANFDELVENYRRQIHTVCWTAGRTCWRRRP